MTLKSELMAAGIPANAAGLLAQDAAATGLTATGSTQGGALTLTSNASIFGTVAASTGAILGSDGEFFVYNGGANALTVYPPVGGNINGGTTNAGFSVAAAKAAHFVANGLTWFAMVSA